MDHQARQSQASHSAQRSHLAHLKFLVSAHLRALAQTLELAS
jgi:hypothetical protein